MGNAGSVLATTGLVVVLGLTGYLLTISTRLALRRAEIARG